MAVRLWNPTGKECHIGLTSGHTLVVSGAREGTEVPKMFRREAIARGCIPVGMDDDTPESEPTFDRRKAVLGGIKTMFDSDEPGMFTAAGKPNLAALNKILGFTIDRNEANDAMAEFEGTGKYAKKGQGDDESDDAPSIVSVK